MTDSSSAVKPGVNSAMLASMKSHEGQGSMVSGDGGQGSNALGKIGGGIDDVIASNQNLDSAVSMFVANVTDLKQLLDAAGQTLGFNINSGGLPKEITTIAPNDKVTQDISLGSFNPIGNREGQKH
jgi:hypothetical protein